LQKTENDRGSVEQQLIVPNFFISGREVEIGSLALEWGKMRIGLLLRTCYLLKQMKNGDILNMK
jgi:hypothetical protein